MSLPGVQRYRVYVSQDGRDDKFSQVMSKFPGVKLLQRDRKPRSHAGQGGTAFLAQHYKDALDRLFITFQHSHAVVCEDDMVFAPDFLTLFERAGPLLHQDDTLWCVSSWNDFGFAEYVSDRARLFRTDFFPGLGWLLRRELWLELSPKFPLDHWDHWMRTFDASQGRECIVPEVSRNFNIGETSGATTTSSFYDKYLRRIALNDRDVDFGDLSYLLHDNYEQQMQTLVSNARYVGVYGSKSPDRANVDAAISSPPRGQVLLVAYIAEQWKQLARRLKLPETPARTTHHGLIVLKNKGSALLLADRRHCPYIPANLQLRPRQDLRVVTANTAESCDSACKRNELGPCLYDQMVFLNDCSVLQRFFACENGCQAGVIGDDLPNYVVAKKKKSAYHRCLMAEQPGRCSGSHWSSQRLCPCQNPLQA